jgi:hypothetical protein
MNALLKYKTKNSLVQPATEEFTWDRFTAPFRQLGALFTPRDEAPVRE